MSKKIKAWLETHRKAHVCGFGVTVEDSFVEELLSTLYVKKNSNEGT